MAIDRDSTVEWMRGFAAAIAEHRAELVQLDTAIGDGDHGTNMDRGMRKAIEQLDESPPEDPGGALKTVAMALVSSVGGAAGPLYGTLLLKLGGELEDEPEPDLHRFAAAWRVALDGVIARGKAAPGDKTMIDALEPAVAALARATDLDAGLAAAAAAAEEGMRATTPLVARRGRASYLGERSAGHQDPGATSTYHLFKSAAEALAD
ncbi:MAG: dihydroxyacetone kinase subunit DhaL [Solirubrobacteraceae bacterium]